MREISPRLWCGSQEDYESRNWAGCWSFVQACKEPYHRQELGYTGRAAPKDHEEYLYCIRDHGRRLVLNLVDTPNPEYVPREIIDVALEFIAAQLAEGRSVFVHCNQGKSRSPVLCLLHLAPDMDAEFEAAARVMKDYLYPDYEPADGMRGFAEAHWPEYHARAA